MLDDMADLFMPQSAHLPAVPLAYKDTPRRAGDSSDTDTDTDYPPPRPQRQRLRPRAKIKPPARYSPT